MGANKRRQQGCEVCPELQSSISDLLLSPSIEMMATKQYDMALERE